MSKTSVRKKVSEMEQQKLVELVMDLYNIKEAKKYLENLFEPQFEKHLEETKRKINSEFAPSFRSRKRFTEAKKVISDFKQLNPPPEMVADLMLYLPEKAAEVWNTNYVNPYSQFDTSIGTNLDAAIKYIVEKGLWEKFRERILKLKRYSGRFEIDEDGIYDHIDDMDLMSDQNENDTESSLDENNNTSEI